MLLPWPDPDVDELLIAEYDQNPKARTPDGPHSARSVVYVFWAAKHSRSSNSKSRDEFVDL